MGMSAPERRGGPVASLNVTPLADVMIVLLVIFMVVTPLVRRGQVERLPAAVHAREQAEAEGVAVSIAADTTLFLAGRRLETAGELLLELRSRFEERPETARWVRVEADERLAYAEVRRVLDLCREAGAEQVALAARRRIGG